MKQLFEELREALHRGSDAVLVSIVASSGSTPRGAGARMLVTDRGRVCGTVGGGAVEYHSEQVAAEVLANGTSRMERFQLHKNQVLDLGMICGGDVHVYFHRLSHTDPRTVELVEDIRVLFAAREPAWLITELPEEGTGSFSAFSPGRGVMGAPVPPEILAGLGNRPVQLRAEGRTYYCEKLIQPDRVFIFGGGHVAQKLVPALAAVDFRCVVLEDREDFCSPRLFPGVEETRLVDNADPGTYADITPHDYVCVMTRGHKDDTLVQSHILKTPACYIGVIGSRKKTAGVFARLREMGFTDGDLERITTPIGLDIKAETPAEIAVSITAQLILRRAELSSMG